MISTRGTNSEKSDIDLAVTDGDALNFYYNLEEKAHTLLMFDVVAINHGISEELQREIEKDGMVIYEKVWELFQGTCWKGCASVVMLHVFAL